MTLKLGQSYVDYVLRYKDNRSILTWIIGSFGYQEAVEEFKVWNPLKFNPYNPTMPGGWENPMIGTPTFKEYEKAARLEYYKLAGRASWAV